MLSSIMEIILGISVCFTGLGIIYLYIANLRSTIKTLEVHLELANNAIHIKNSTLKSTEVQLDKNKDDPAEDDIVWYAISVEKSEEENHQNCFDDKPRKGKKGKYLKDWE